MPRGVALLTIALVLTACSAMPPAAPAGTGSSAYARAGQITMPNAPRAFDHAVVDDAARMLYLADRSNGTVDVFSLATEMFVASIGGFHGGGPNGVELLPDRGELWAADADSSVKVIDLVRRSVVATVRTDGHERSDDLAYDAKDHIVVVGNDSESTPFLTFISAADRTVKGRLDFPGALGLEEVHWRAERDLFYQAVPATDRARDGEIDVIDPLTMKVVKTIALSECGPHGIALGPADEILVGCGTARALIIDASSGAIVGQFPQIGGTDVVWFDPARSRYLLAGSATGTGGSSSRGPAIGVVDAVARRWIDNVATVSGAHSVVADPRTGRMYVPFPGLGLAVFAPGG